MRKKIFAIMLVMAVGCMTLFGGAGSVYAETFEGTNSDGDSVNPDEMIGEATKDTTVDLDHYKDEVVYSITITTGAMKFTYDYGATWNPSTHEYEMGQSGNAQGGWLDSDKNGVNNKITIKNDSNYPITAKMSYANNGELAGLSSTGDPVKGVFADDAACTSSPSASKEVDVDMDFSKCSAAGLTYWKLSTGPNVGNSTVDVFFAYTGTPKGISSEKQTIASAGTISIKLYPSLNVTKTTNP